MKSNKVMKRQMAKMQRGYSTGFVNDITNINYVSKDGSFVSVEFGQKDDVAVEIMGTILKGGILNISSCKILGLTKNISLKEKMEMCYNYKDKINK